MARDEFRRRRNRLLVPIGLVIVAASAWALTRSSLLDADRVVVAGTERTTPEEVLSAARLAPGDQLVDLDAVAVRRRIEATLPWVASARVSRSWPGTLRITVVERRAVAQVQAVDGRWFMIDVGGRLLDTADLPDPALVTIDGTVPEGEPGAMLVDRAARAVAVLDGLSPGLQTRIGLLRFVGTDEVEFGLRPAGRVALGRPEQVAQKLQDLDTVLARVDGACLSAIDLRVPAKPLVQRNADCLAAQEDS